MTTKEAISYTPGQVLRDKRTGQYVRVAKGTESIKLTFKQGPLVKVQPLYQGQKFWVCAGEMAKVDDPRGWSGWQYLGAVLVALACVAMGAEVSADLMSHAVHPVTAVIVSGCTAAMFLRGAFYTTGLLKH